MVEGFRDVENEEFSVIPVGHNMSHFDRHLSVGSDNIARWSAVDNVKVLVLSVFEFTFATTSLRFFVIEFLIVVENGVRAYDKFLDLLSIECEGFF